MRDDRTPDRARALGPASAAGLACATGLLVGAGFGLRDAVREYLVAEFFPRTLSGVLSLTSQAVLWYGLGGAVLGTVAGAFLWAGSRTHGWALTSTQVLAAAAGIACFVALPDGLAHVGEYPEGLLGGIYTVLDIGSVSVLTGLGLGCVAWLLDRRVSSPGRLLAGAAGLLSTAFVLGTWGLWMRMGHMTDLGPWGRLRFPVLVALAVAMGIGVAFVLSWLLRRCPPEGRRSAARGFVLLTGAAACLACAPMVLDARPEELGIAASDGVPDMRADRPNILWVVMDTCRADALSCYGNPRKTTPNLDKLAAEGTLYERCYANAPWTLPSHASMFTGLLPSQHGATAEYQYLRDEHETIAEVLRRHGYRTFGCSANPLISATHNFTQGFERFEVYSYGATPLRATLAGRVLDALHLGDYGASLMNTILMAWLRQVPGEGQPFFAFVSYMEMHGDYGSTPEQSRWFSSEDELKRACSLAQVRSDHASGVAAKTRDEFALLRTLYDGDMTYLDRRIGEVVSFLREADLLDDTLIIISSDHGEELGEHGLLGHAFGAYNTLLHVPLIIRYPRLMKSGLRISRVTENIDILPTLLDVVGVRSSGGLHLQGRSLLDHNDDVEPRTTVSEKDIPVLWMDVTLNRYADWRGRDIMIRQKTIQDAGLKYAWSSNGEQTLYDLRADPLERVNVIERMAEDAVRLRTILVKRVGPLDAGRSAAGAARAAGSARQ